MADCCRWLSGVVLLLALMLGGCSAAGLAAYVVGGDDETLKVPAAYRGMDGKSVAVLVSADETVLHFYPQAPLAVSQAVSMDMAAVAPTAKLMDPRQVIAFQNANPAWLTTNYAQLMARLKVDRLIHVDLSEYTTHEPGNTHQWRGIIAARVSVAAGDSEQPANPVFATTLRNEYPPNSTVGLLNSDDQTIQLGMLKGFSQQVAWLFVDHKERRPR